MDCSTFSFDLHVLGTPPALILSQDQTLVWNLLFPTEVGNRLSTESIDKPYLVRSLEKISSIFLTTGTFNLLSMIRLRSPH